MPHGLAQAVSQAPALYREGNGVDDGTRTHDNRNHNPGLYQLSYVHHWEMPGRLDRFGAPGETRTHNPRLRRPVLYPVELRAPFDARRYWSG